MHYYRTLIQNAPPGLEPEIILWPSAAIPTNYSLCDGSAISRTTYADLYAEIGDTYGAGDGSTTFNLPDYRGTFLRFHAEGSANDPDRASRTDRGDGTTGDNIGTKQDYATGDHGHSVVAAAAILFGTARCQTSGNFTKSATSGSNGTGEARPNNIAINHIIRVTL